MTPAKASNAVLRAVRDSGVVDAGLTTRSLVRLVALPWRNGPRRRALLVVQVLGPPPGIEKKSQKSKSEEQE